MSSYSSWTDVSSSNVAAIYASIANFHGSPVAVHHETGLKGAVARNETLNGSVWGEFDPDDPPSFGNTHELPYSVAEMVLIAFVAGLLSIVTVVGNVMVMISFKMDKQLQTISNYFLLSLAIADFSIGIISMPLYTIYILVDRWPLGPLMCDTWLALDYLNSNASVLNLLIISFDRYFSVTRPLTYRAHRTTRRATLMIAGAWIISLVMWPPWIFSWPYIEGQRTVPDDECYIQFLETNSYLTFATALAAFYVPVTVMCILYWRIWRETEKRQKDLTHLQAGKKDDSKKSTSSNGDTEDCRARLRADSCLPDEATVTTETTYIPTSLCTVRYYPPSTSASAPASVCGSSKHKPPSSLAHIFNQMLSWCRAEKDEGGEEDSTSHGSPAGANTPASVETPVQSSSRTTSMSFKPEHQITHLTSAAVPLRSLEGSDRRGASSAQPAALSSSATFKPSASRSVSSDSVYTIVIRLPLHAVEGDSVVESQPSIKMILEEEHAPAEVEATRAVLQPVRSSLSMGALSSCKTEPVPLHSHQLAHLRTSESALETIRIPLSTKLVHKQVVKTRAPAKKKRKQQERKQDKKAAKTLSAILLAFIITWTPYNVLVLIKTLASCDNDECIPIGLWYFAYYLCYINSTVNPLCYALCNANFRRTYVRILSCKWQNKLHHVMNRGYFS